MKPADWQKKFKGHQYNYFRCAIKVVRTSDFGNDTLLGHKNAKGEFAVANHGIRLDDDLIRVNQIFITHLKEGYHNICSNLDDKFHPGQKCGKDIYATSFIDAA